MTRSFFKSLRWQMPLLVLLGVVPPMVLAIFYASSRAATIIRQETTQHFALKATSIAESVTRWQETYVLALENLAKQPEIISMNPKQQKPVLRRTIDTYQNLYVAHTIGLDGFNVARSDDKPLKSYADRLWFQGAIAGNEVNYQTLIGRVSNKPSVCISKPIRGQQAVIKGVVTICSQLEALSQQIGTIRFGQTGYAFVVDEEGKVIAHPNPAISASNQLTDFSHYPPVQAILNGKSGLLQFREKNRIKWFCHVIRLDNGWGIVVLQQKAEALSQEYEFKKLASIIAAVAVLGVVIITWLVARHLLQPIEDLTVAATNLANGDLDRRIDSNREDELGMLSRSFDRMAQQLQNSFATLAEANQNLEKRVKERTIELEQAMEMAESGNRTKGQFLANMSHELRTPLNSILGYAQILQRDRNLYESQVEELKIIHKSGNHLLNLIDDVLDFSKIEANKMTLCPGNVDLPVFLKEVTAIVGLKAKEKNLLFTFEKQGLLPNVIRIDEKRLKQILLNLLINAVKYTDRGQVKLKVSILESVPASDLNSSENIKISFEISDTGVGISPSNIKKIFHPFEQVGDLESRITGTGLGLAIGQQIAELMGSEIKVSSQLGQGSTFWFDIVVPIVEIAEALPCLEASASKIVSYKGQKITLLVVDDRPENCLLISNILKPLGFEIIVAENGEEGLRIARQSNPDLILTDLFMRVKTGFTMVKELRKIPEFKHLPIIATSANSVSSVRHESKQVGCNAFIAKPIEEKRLLDLLKSYLKLEWISN